MVQKSTKPLLKIGSRSSLLAKVQVREVLALLRQQKVAVNPCFFWFSTSGDRDRQTLLSQEFAGDFFTDALDQALLAGTIDVAIHSAKDLPEDLPPGLAIFALTASEDESDALVAAQRLKDLPVGARIGTSSGLRQQAVLGINSKVRLIPVRGTVDERLTLLDQGKLDGLIVATCALKRLGLNKRIKEIMPWETMPLQGQLAVVGRSNDVKLRKLLASIDVRQRYGKVYLVGAGPGAPDLMTLRGIEALKRADCVFYDYLVDPRLLAYASSKAEKVYVGKRKGKHSMPQAKLSRLLLDRARSGKVVVRLKGGDPLVFGRGAEEMNYLHSYKVDCEVIPGISSATGIPSSLSLPLTARRVASSVAFLSGHGEAEPERSAKALRIPQADTLIFFMGLTKLDAIVKQLIRQGWNKQTPVLIISKGTTRDQRLIQGTLADIVDRVDQIRLPPPALIMVGEVLKLSQDFRTQFGSQPFFSKPKAPLTSKSLLYLGTRPEKYRVLGRMIPFPMIAIKRVQPSAEEMSRVLAQFSFYSLVIFTSAHSVNFFIKLLREYSVDLKYLRSKSIAVVGQDTAEALRQYFLTPQFVATQETSEGLWQVLHEQYSVKGKNILFPRSNLSNPFLKAHLQQAGAHVTELTVYQNIKPPKRPLPALNKVSSVFFSSPSTVINFLKDYQQIPQGWQIYAKGERTRDYLRERGYVAAMVQL